MDYVYVESGNIVEGPCQLPSVWRHVSNLNLLGNSDLALLGWLPYYRNYTSIVPRTQKFVLAQTTFHADRVEADFEAEDKTTQEIEAEILEGWSGVRRQRDALLLACDWTQLEDSTADKEEWAAYRALLRNVPQVFSHPGDVVWPPTP